MSKLKKPVVKELAKDTLALAKQVGILTLDEYESKVTGSSAIWCTYSKDAVSGMWYADTWEKAYERAEEAVKDKLSRRKKK